jgi:hypothetical protein
MGINQSIDQPVNIAVWHRDEEFEQYPVFILQEVAILKGGYLILMKKVVINTILKLYVKFLAN